MSTDFRAEIDALEDSAVSILQRALIRRAEIDGEIVRLRMEIARAEQREGEDEECGDFGIAEGMAGREVTP